MSSLLPSRVEWVKSISREILCSLLTSPSFLLTPAPATHPTIPGFLANFSRSHFGTAEAAIAACVEISQAAAGGARADEEVWLMDRFFRGAYDQEDLAFMLVGYGHIIGKDRAGVDLGARRLEDVECARLCLEMFDAETVKSVTPMFWSEGPSAPLPTAARFLSAAVREHRRCNGKPDLGAFLPGSASRPAAPGGGGAVNSSNISISHHAPAQPPASTPRVSWREPPEEASPGGRSEDTAGQPVSFVASTPSAAALGPAAYDWAERLAGSLLDAQKELSKDAEDRLALRLIDHIDTRLAAQAHQASQAQSLGATAKEQIARMVKEEVSAVQKKTEEALAKAMAALQFTLVQSFENEVASLRQDLARMQSAIQGTILQNQPVAAQKREEEKKEERAKPSEADLARLVATQALLRRPESAARAAAPSASASAPSAPSTSTTSSEPLLSHPTLHRARPAHHSPPTSVSQSSTSIFDIAKSPGRKSVSTPHQEPWNPPKKVFSASPFKLGVLTPSAKAL
jgi:hypothetical protein